jgi:hypothetical protein
MFRFDMSVKGGVAEVRLTTRTGKISAILIRPFSPFLLLLVVFCVLYLNNLKVLAIGLNFELNI